jgi:hypothetical protein
MRQPRGQKCIRYKCVPAKRGHSAGCPPRHVKRCADFR